MINQPEKYYFLDDDIKSENSLNAPAPPFVLHLKSDTDLASLVPLEGTAESPTSFIILISLTLFRPDYVLDKFYPNYEYAQLQINNLQFINLKPDRDTHIRVTRRTEYGDRYKLFVINKDSFKENYSLEEYGVNLVDKEGRMTIDTLKWNGLAKKSGVAAIKFQTGLLRLKEIKEDGKGKKNFIKKVIFLNKTL